MIRKAAIWFALLSAVYWGTVQAFWEGARTFGLSAFGLPDSSWVAWIVGGLPILLYSVLCVLYFHAFAKRVLELATRSSEA